jgi:hypothetical protein
VAEHHVARPQDPDGRLNGMLARWAEAHRLGPGQIETIRQHVVSEAEPPDFDWWWRLLDPESGTAFRSLRRSAARWAEPPTFEPPVAPPSVWIAAQSRPASWAHDADDFQPYLRLS